MCAYPEKKAIEKIKTAEELRHMCAEMRRQGAKVVFTNGCFDLLHLGHVRYLEAARDLGDFLAVGVNSDASVRCIKGPQRPLISQRERSEVLAALQCVDGVTIFDEPDPLALIKLIGPNVLVKGADWPIEKIIGSDVVQKSGGSVVTIPLVQNISTSEIIRRILARYGQETC